MLVRSRSGCSASYVLAVCKQCSTDLTPGWRTKCKAKNRVYWKKWSDMKLEGSCDRVSFRAEGTTEGRHWPRAINRGRTAIISSWSSISGAKCYKHFFISNSSSVNMPNSLEWTIAGPSAGCYIPGTLAFSRDAKWTAIIQESSISIEMDNTSSWIKYGGSATKSSDRKWMK